MPLNYSDKTVRDCIEAAVPPCPVGFERVDFSFGYYEDTVRIRWKTTKNYNPYKHDNTDWHIEASIVKIVEFDDGNYRLTPHMVESQSGPRPRDCYYEGRFRRAP